MKNMQIMITYPRKKPKNLITYGDFEWPQGTITVHYAGDSWKLPTSFWTFNMLQGIANAQIIHLEHTTVINIQF